jgi:hypothetical protein
LLEKMASKGFLCKHTEQCFGSWDDIFIAGLWIRIRIESTLLYRVHTRRVSQIIVFRYREIMGVDCVRNNVKDSVVPT